MTQLTERRTLIVPAGFLENANIVGNVLDPDTGGIETFSAGAGEYQSGPISHYVSSVPLKPEYAALLDNEDPSLLYYAVASLSVERDREFNLTEQECSNLRAAMIVRAEGVQTVLSESGLTLVKPDEDI